MTEFAVVYAAQNERDHEVFRKAVAAARIEAAPGA